jgi:predicted secreted protein
MVRRHSFSVPVALAALVLLSACASGPVTLSDPPAESVVSVKRGQEVVVALPSNRTTGYSWLVMRPLGTEIERLGEPVYVEDSRNAVRVGAGGIETWRFRANERGESSITLGYRRSFERGTQPLRVVRIRVMIT